MDRIDHAVLAGMATVAILFTILAFLYPGGTLFSYPSPHVGVAILGKTVGAGLMTALIHWLKQRQLGRQAQR
jgi:uncharacterized integral membrane protein